MADEHAVPQQQEEKKQGDKLDHVINGVLDKGTGLAQDPSKDNERKPSDEPLK